MAGAPSSGCQPTGSSVPGTWARASALFIATGPPLNTTDGSVASSVHGSSTWPTGTLVGRFSTTPSVPCSVSCSTIRTTVRRKLGSPSTGVATSRRPARTSDAISSIYLSSFRLLGRSVERRRDAAGLLHGPSDLAHGPATAGHLQPHGDGVGDARRHRHVGSRLSAGPQGTARTAYPEKVSTESVVDEASTDEAPAVDVTRLR